jgi:hypothetical protein
VRRTGVVGDGSLLPERGPAQQFHSMQLLTRHVMAASDPKRTLNGPPKRNIALSTRPLKGLGGSE